MVVKHIVKMERKERKKNGEKEGSNKKEGNQWSGGLSSANEEKKFP